MNREEFLAQHTFTEEGFPAGKRVAETLMAVPAQQAMRSAKLLGGLTQLLLAKGMLSPKDLDDLLFDAL
jgi:hypothetical protein